jgi:DNA-binding winged helix-turn-helix (wHTH) protein
MPETFVYEFDGFSLNPSTGVLLRDGRLTPLRAKPFELLLILVENAGRAVTKEEFINRVWSGATVTDANFHVNLNAIRRALGDKGRDAHFIKRTSGGYKFVGDVRKVTVEVLEQDVVKQNDRIQRPSGHLIHIVAVCAIYAALYSEAVLLEVAYDFNRYSPRVWAMCAIALGWIMVTSLVGLAVSRSLSSKHATAGLALSLAVFFVGAGLLFTFLVGFLPSFPITHTSFQAYSAQASYLKDTVYFLALAFFFLILPFHFVVTTENERKRHQDNSLAHAGASIGISMLTKGAIYPRFWALALLLLLFGVISLVMTAHLLDNLEPGSHTNLFTQLVYLRGILYFGLGIECLVWYRSNLNEIKRNAIRAQ